MQKKITGFCPTQQKNYSIDITYINASDLEGTQYVKGTFRCEYDLFGDKCNENDCPIYKQAPDNI